MKNQLKQDNEIIWIYSGSKNSSNTVMDFGFIDVEWKEKWYFVFWRNSLNAIPWDKVLAIVKLFKGKEEAIVKKIIERRKDPIVWIYKDNWKYGFVIPNNPCFKKDIFIPWSKSYRAKEWEIVVVNILKWEWRNPEWNIIKVLWKPWDKWVDILAIAMENWARIGFWEAVQKELQKITNINLNFSKGAPEERGGEIIINEYKKRKDLRNLLTITIDWQDSKDLDDAISIVKYPLNLPLVSRGVPEGGGGIKNKEQLVYKLYVHIADVAHYVKEEHAIDKEARRRWTSIYLVDEVIPMLPKELSNWLCSLNPNEDKLTLTCEIEINQKWHIINTEVYESIIKSNHRLTYKEVDDVIINKNLPLVLSGMPEAGGVISMLQQSEELRQILTKYKKSLWVLEFDFPETKIIVNKNWDPIEFKKYERYNSNKIIEEFMVMANEAISRKFSDIPFLYRIHPKPSEEDLENLQRKLALFSYNIPNFKDINSKEIASILNEIKNDKKEKLLSKMVLRSLTKAIYSEVREWHFGLALNYYSHFTSPIRRYPDLQIHRIIKEKIHWKLDKEKIKHYKNILPKVAKKSSESEKKAEKLEYRVRDLMAIKFMKDKIWQKFEAYISWVIEYWIFVELDNTIEWFIELNNKYWDHDFILDSDLMEMNNKKTWQKFSFWDKINVKLSNIDEKLLRLNFEIV